CYIGKIARSSPNVINSEEIEEIIAYDVEKFSIRYSDCKAIVKIYKLYLVAKIQLIASVLPDLIKQKEINLCIVWNGADYRAAAVAKIAEKMDKKIIYIETGQFPNTLELDKEGVNAASSLSRKDKSFFSKIKIDKKKIKKLHNVKVETRDLRKDRVTNYIRTQNINKPEAIDLPKRYFFVPFQVHTDSQFIVNSVYVKNMYQFVDCCYEALVNFNQENNEDYWLVIKEHPSDFGRINYSDLKEKYRDEKVLFLTDYEIDKLIAGSELVITLNSSVGIESLLQYKPVITLGKANYNIKGVVYHVSSGDSLSQALERAISRGVNKDLIDKFLQYFRYDYLVEGNKNNPAVSNNIKVIKEIEEHL
ncbi:MAG: hypothetical protein ACOCZT_01815, partial [Halanaerobiales bacterium]